MEEKSEEEDDDDSEEVTLRRFGVAVVARAILGEERASWGWRRRAWW